MTERTRTLLLSHCEWMELDGVDRDPLMSVDIHSDIHSCSNRFQNLEWYYLQ